jgi:hypothetical protein
VNAATNQLSSASYDYNGNMTWNIVPCAARKHESDFSAANHDTDWEPENIVAASTVSCDFQSCPYYRLLVGSRLTRFFTTNSCDDFRGRCHHRMDRDGGFELIEEGRRRWGFSGVPGAPAAHYLVLTTH